VSREEEKRCDGFMKCFLTEPFIESNVLRSPDFGRYGFFLMHAGEFPACFAMTNGPFSKWILPGDSRTGSFVRRRALGSRPRTWAGLDRSRGVLAWQ